MVEEFLEGVFHFDGKVFRTAGLLMFKPGQLTKRFLEGPRMPYVPPIRLYVFISFVFLPCSRCSGGLTKPKSKVQTISPRKSAKNISLRPPTRATT